MKVPHPIPYQGSKRNLSSQILQFFPSEVNRLVEPFAGSAAISVASAFYLRANKFWLNDINEPLILLWEKIINSPEEMVKSYHDLWIGQLDQEENYYYKIREDFNKTQSPELLHFLLAKCVKAAVRYNSEGEFNQSPDKRRKGKRPANMSIDILGVSRLLKDKSEFTSLDYVEVIEKVVSTDLVYLDPPYQGTGKSRGFRYLQDVSYDDFVMSLFMLNEREVPYLLSYDGRTGTKSFGKELPKSLKMKKIELHAGRSSTATLHNRKEDTFESLYLSEVLLDQIDLNQILNPNVNTQLSLFD